MNSPAQVRRAETWELLRACCTPRPAAERIHDALRRPLNWDAVLTLAEKHGVLPLLAKTLMESGGMVSVPESAQRRLEKLQHQYALYSLALTAEFFRIAERFRAAGIESVVVKGTALAAQAHGDHGLRQIADLDVLVRHRDVFRAAAAVAECGFTLQIPLATAAKKTPGQFLFVREETRAVMELHSERTLRYFPRAIPIEAFFARRVEVAVGGGIAPALSPEDTLVFICVHGSKHFWERLLWIADVAGLLERHGALDWECVFAAARETQAGRMLRLGLCLAKDVLGVELHPRAIRELETDATAASFAQEIGEKLASGEPLSRTAWRRAILRMRMCEDNFRGAAYLLRLTFAPTEEDWGAGEPGSHASWAEAIRRPLRLAKKHRVAAGASTEKGPALRKETGRG